MSGELPHDLSAEEAAFVETVDAMVAGQLAPAAADIDERGTIDPQLVDVLAGQDLLTVGFPEASGGAGLRVGLLVLERVARVSAAAACVVAAAHDCAALGFQPAHGPATAFDGDPAGGSIPVLADGRDGIGYAELAGGGWVLDGSAGRVELAGQADHLLVVAHDGRGEAAAFEVEARRPEVVLGPEEAITGLHGVRPRSVALSGCRLPASSRVAGPDGVRAVRRHRALSSAAMAVGIAAAACDAAGRYAAERRQFDRRLDQFVALRDLLAGARVRTGAAAGLLWEAARRPGVLSSPTDPSAAAAARQAIRTAVSVASDAVQVFGGYGYTRGQPVERYLRDAVSIGARAGGSRLLLAEVALAQLGPVERTA